MELSGKVALITGGSRGIGRAIAAELAKAGTSVVISYKSNVKAAEETVRAIRDEGGYADLCQCDVSDYSQVKALVQYVLQNFGKLDILVNNAGVSKVGLFSDMSESEYIGVIHSNLTGTLNATHCVLKTMIHNKRGNIINISSIWGESGASCEAVYSASKGGINAFTKALAKEMAPSGIRVNAIAPGVIKTDMNKWLSEEELRSIVEDIPIGRLGTASDIGRVAVFLCSEAASYITGQILTVDGGFL
jgi:3-oxoacyl-[acyl-carrier protein] reductase